MKRSDHNESASLHAVLVCSLAFALLFAGSSLAAAQGLGANQASVAPPYGSMTRLAGNTAQEVLDGTAIRLDHYDPAQKLRLAIVLTPPHLAEEHQFLEDVQNKQSPLFHQFLSAEEWNARFAPSAEDEQAVVDWATSQGLTVTQRYPNRLLVDLEAPAGTIEKAFQVTLNHYLLPASDGFEARTVFANDRDPVLPQALENVVEFVAGLESIHVMRPAAGRGQLTPQPDYTPGPVTQVSESAQRDADPQAVAELAGGIFAQPDGAGQPQGYDPRYFYSSDAYDYQALMTQGHCCNPLDNPTDHTPRETSIAIAIDGDVSLADVATFQTYFPYLAFNVEKILINGGYTCNNSKGVDDACTEASMDTEWSMVTANSEGSASATAKIYVYEGDACCDSGSLTLFNQMLKDAHARTMSISQGIAEGTDTNTEKIMQSMDNIFSQMAGEGWTLVAASGDQGATGACSDATLIEFPASDPNFVAAGGTHLAEGSDSATYEVAWTGSTSPGACNHNGGGSTGGFSVYWPTPGFQSGMNFATRATPDISLDTTLGHDVYVDGQWGYLGGTSVSAPMLAGFFAQDNAYLLSVGDICGSKGNAECAPIGNANYAIYEEGLKHNGARIPFYDIVSGCNTNDITKEYPSLKYYCAGPGYDEVTGWGSANMLQLAWALNWEIIPANGVPYITWSGPAANKWYNTNQTVSWTIHDWEPAGSTPGTGIAGETQGWDSLPADPNSEPHGGSGDSFLDGPQFPNGKTGCLAFEPNGCSGGVSQGCHTAYARGWNNQGESTAGNSSYPETYGPICYDTVPPVTTASIKGTSGVSGIYPDSITLSATDSTSGVAATYYTLDGGSQIKYSKAFVVSTLGNHTLNFWSVDVAGNVEKTNTTTFDIVQGTTTTLTASPNPAFFGNSVTLTAKVKPANSGTPTGSVEFLDGANDLVGGTLNSSGVATVTVNGLALGAHSLYAIYAGDTTNGGSTSNTVTETINTATTTTALKTSTNSTAYEEIVNLTATVTSTGGMPTGTVTFLSNGISIGTQALASGVAVLTTKALKVGTDSVTASYGGAAGINPSASSAVSVEIGPSPTGTRIASSLNPSTVGASVTFTATVISAVGPALGTVTFKDGTTSLGTGTLTGGRATVTTTKLAEGAHSITADYDGETDYAPSTSSDLTQTVNAAVTAARVVYIPDYYGGLLQVRVGTGTTATAITIDLPSCSPNSVAVNSNKAYVVCNANGANPDKILVYNAATIRAAAAGTLSISPSKTITSNQFNSLIGITFDASNNLWVASYSNNQVDEITAAELAAATPTVTASLINSPSSPVALAFDKNGSLWVTGDYDGGILLNFPSSQLGTGVNANPDYCLATTNLGAGCQFVDGVFLSPEGLALFNGDVWVANNSTGAAGNVPGRELVDIKYSGGSATTMGTLTVNSTFGNSAVAADSPFVCPGGLFSGSVHLWVNDESYGETNPQCGAAGDVASETGGVFDFTTTQLTDKTTTVGQVLGYSNITGRPGFGGIFVENDQ